MNTNNTNDTNNNSLDLCNSCSELIIGGDHKPTVSMSRLSETLGMSIFCHRTAQYTLLLPFGRDTVHCLYRVSHISPLRGDLLKSPL